MMKEERRLISVGSGFETKSTRSSQSLKLLNWGFRNTETFKISKSNETIFNVKSWLAKEKFIKGKTNEDLYVTLTKKDSRNLKVLLEYDKAIKAPVKKDQEIASIKVYVKDKLMKSIPVYSLEDVKKINFFQSLFMSLNYLVWGDV